MDGATPPTAEELARELDSRKEAFATLKNPRYAMSSRAHGSQ